MKKTVNVIGFYIVWWGCIFGVLYNYTYSGPLLTLQFIIIHMKFIAIKIYIFFQNRFFNFILLGAVFKCVIYIAAI